VLKFLGDVEPESCNVSGFGTVAEAARRLRVKEWLLDRGGEKWSDAFVTRIAVFRECGKPIEKGGEANRAYTAMAAIGNNVLTD